LRVLAIIAYHQPIKQSDIVKVIGNRTYEYVKELEERGLIKVEKKSRTKTLSTTPHFEDYFGINKDQVRKEFEEMEKEEKSNGAKKELEEEI
jgi:segregation and condensation protein B